MKKFETLFSQKFCDQCHEYADSLVQSEEGNWLCPVCEDTHKCDECGSITDEVPMNDDHVCCDCYMLLDEANRTLDAALAEMIYPTRRVSHI